MQYRAIVTGSRDWDRPLIVAAVLAELRDSYGSDLLIVHGNARGADRLADQWASRHGVAVERWPARWDEEGDAAGPLRNRRMVDHGADRVVAFIRDDSRGTTGCINLALAAGIPVDRYDYADPHMHLFTFAPYQPETVHA